MFIFTEMIKESGTSHAKNQRQEEAEHLRCRTDHLVGFQENIQKLEGRIEVEGESITFAYCYTQQYKITRFPFWKNCCLLSNLFLNFQD